MRAGEDGAHDVRCEERDSDLVADPTAGQTFLTSKIGDGVYLPGKQQIEPSPGTHQCQDERRLGFSVVLVAVVITSL